MQKPCASFKGAQQPVLISARTGSSASCLDLVECLFAAAADTASKPRRPGAPSASHDATQENTADPIVDSISEVPSSLEPKGCHADLAGRDNHDGGDSLHAVNGDERIGA